MKIFVFNPEHDQCLGNGNPNYMPPQTTLRFAQDCCNLMSVLGNDEDICVPASRVGEALREHPDCLEIIPWGWNETLANQMKKQGVKENLILSQSQLEWIKWGSDRKHTSDFANEARLGCSQSIFSEIPIVCKDIEMVEDLLGRYEDLVLKSPLSGSGQGVRPVSKKLSESQRGWVKRILSQHHYFMVERRYRVVQDFAALYQINDIVDFVGYSLFDTHNFTYQGNSLISDDRIKEYISTMIPEKVLEQVVENVGKMLNRHFRPVLRGMLGVDMFVFQKEDGSFGLNPMVEINCRYTMGHVAHALVNKYSDSIGKHFVIKTPTEDNPHYSYIIE